MGGVLSMKCENEKQRPVAYILKLLNQAKRNYKIHNKEILAIIRCLEAQRHFLEDTKSQFKIWTDHYKSSEVELKTGQISLINLSRFDFTLKYVASKSMRQVDSLSRKVDCI